MIKIYHNPRCRKSREGLAFLQDTGKEFEVIRYLDNRLSTHEIEELLKALDMPPIALVRKNEAIWKSDYKGKALSDSQIITALAENPKLIERPVVLKDGRAVVARPVDKINELL
jgi:arsenate reductase